METYIRAGIPVLIWGPPGVGKTAYVRRLAKQLGMHLEVVLASIREPADFLGLPVVINQTTRFVAPDWAQRLAQSGGILFLDEITTAPPAVQSALLRVVLDRVVGDTPLPETVRIVAAGNPPEWAAGGWDLSPPLANRFAHIEWRFDAHQFVRDFPSYWGDPPQLDGVDEAIWLRYRSMVAGFLHARPSLALQLPESESERGKAWASPRTWDMASRLIAHAQPKPIEDAFPLLASCVGEGTAIEFIEWAAKNDLPDPAEVLQQPQQYPLPQRGDILFATCIACAQYAIQDGGVVLWDQCWELLHRVAVQLGMADVAGASASVLARHRPTGARVRPEMMRPFQELFGGGGNGN